MSLRPRLLPLLLPVVLLTACVTQQETTAQKATNEQMAQASREKQCGAFGYKPNTPDYSRCLENLYLQDKQLAAAEDANRQERVASMGDKLRRAGAALQSINPPSVSCTTMPNGIGGTRTSCQ